MLIRFFRSPFGQNEQQTERIDIDFTTDLAAAEQINKSGINKNENNSLKDISNFDLKRMKTTETKKGGKKSSRSTNKSI